MTSIKHHQYQKTTYIENFLYLLIMSFASTKTNDVTNFRHKRLKVFMLMYPPYQENLFQKEL